MESHQKIIIQSYQAISKLMEYYNDDFAKTLQDYQCANPKFELISFKEVAKQAVDISKKIEEGQEMIDFEEYLISQIEYYQKVLHQKIVLEEANMEKTYCIQFSICESEDELEEEEEVDNEQNIFEKYEQEPKLQKKIKKDNDDISSPEQKYPKQVIQEYIDNMQQNTDNTFIINYLNSLMKLLNYETQETQYILDIQTLNLFISLDSYEVTSKMSNRSYEYIEVREDYYEYEISDINLKNNQRFSINKIFVSYNNKDEGMYIRFQYEPYVSYPDIYCDSDVVAEINCFHILNTSIISGKSVVIKIDPDIFNYIKPRRLEKLIGLIEQYDIIEMERDIEIDQLVYLEAGKFCKTSKRIFVNVDDREKYELFSNEYQLFYLNQLVIKPPYFGKMFENQKDIDDMFDSNVLFTYTDRKLNYGIEMLLQILVLEKNIKDVLLNSIAKVVYDLIEYGW